MNLLKQNHPQARIVFISNSDIKTQIIDGMKSAAEKIGVEYVALANIDKRTKHPTVLGMQQIYEQLMKHFEGKGVI